MKIISIIAGIVFLFLSLVGLTTLCLFLHETVHIYDYKEINLDPEIRILTFEVAPGKSLKSFPTQITFGKTKITGNLTDEEEYDRISEYTELKAILISLIPVIIWMIFFYFVYLQYINYKPKNPNI